MSYDSYDDVKPEDLGTRAGHESGIPEHREVLHSSHVTGSHH